jgi:chitinase
MRLRTTSEDTNHGEHPTGEGSGRRLSVLRLVVATATIGALVVGGFIGYQWWMSLAKAGSTQPWFAGYVDVTATPTFDFGSPATKAGRNVLLSFIVSAPDGPCTPTWGSALHAGPGIRES